MTTRVIVAPGAYKHSLSVGQAVDAICAGLEESALDVNLVRLPIADGGNGTVDAFLAHGGERIVVSDVFDPAGRSIDAAFGLIDDGTTAVIEMALASGLELLEADERDPFRMSTYGTGQLMQAALDYGVERVIVGMGGSATVDGGIGCVGALGVRFADAHGVALPPVPDSLKHVGSIDASGLDPRWKTTQVVIASDVENLTLGREGAAAVFGPQKGASQSDVAILEERLAHYFDRVYQHLGVDVRTLPGGGAAGALSAGLVAFLGAELVSGVDLLLRHADFATLLETADMVITGEGKIDAQTLQGKGPLGIVRTAQAQGIPVIAIVGAVDADVALLHDNGFAAVLSLVDRPMALDDALRNAQHLLQKTARQLGDLLQVGQRLGV